MFHWIHHLFNPHCRQCMLDQECKNCDLLRSLIVDLRNDIRFLIEKDLMNNEPEKESSPNVQVPQPIGGFTTWNQRKRELEKKAALLRAEQENSEKLAKENYQPRSIEEIEQNVELGSN